MLARSLRPMICLGLVPLMLGGLIGCQRQNEFVPPPPPEVTVARPVEREVVDTIEFTGTTRSTATVSLRARVNGYLERIAFEDGATVQKGDLLFVIEQAPFETALQAAQAELQKAQATLKLADANLARVTELHRRNVATPSQLDIQKAEQATAAAEVAAAEAAVKQAELDLGYTEIRAPISGRIGRHLVDVGNLIQAEETQLATIESVDPIHVYFHVSERDLLRFMEMVREDQLPDPEKQPPVLNMGLANETGFPHQGHLDYRELGVDPGTGTVLRRGVFPNPDHVLIPGLFVRISAPVGRPEPRLLVEERAIGSDQRGDYLLVVNEKGVVEYRPVELGIAVGGLRVVRDGVSEDDWIVTNGLQRARPGTTVNPQRAGEAVAESDAKPPSGVLTTER
ncbi:MAG: efflux RND transporter periplasmic adaptor subunit [Planctomycetaceae bacterium]